MEKINWKKIIGVGLSVFALSLGSVGLTGCEAGEEAEEVEVEDGEELEMEDGEELEVEDD